MLGIEKYDVVVFKLFLMDFFVFIMAGRESSGLEAALVDRRQGLNFERKTRSPKPKYQTKTLSLSVISHSHAPVLASRIRKREKES